MTLADADVRDKLGLGPRESGGMVPKSRNSTTVRIMTSWQKPPLTQPLQWGE